MQVKSTIKLNMPRISQLTRAAVVALEQTAEALHTEVVQAQGMPFDTGNLQNESTFVDTSEASSGKCKPGIQHAICKAAVLPSGISVPEV